MSGYIVSVPDHFGTVQYQWSPALKSYHFFFELGEEADVITSTKRWMMDHCMYLIGDGWVGSDPCDQGTAFNWLKNWPLIGQSEAK